MESYWEEVKDRYVVQHPLLNLNNAAVNPPTKSVQDETIRALKFVNQSPDFNMWSVLDLSLPLIKKGLASLIDCDSEEIALNRNSSEGLSIVIFGIPLEKDDEVIISDWDYPSAISGWKQRAVREGITVRNITFGPLDSDEQIVEAYCKAITPETKVIHLTHMLHWTGRTMPVEKICSIAKLQGIRTVVDGAQTFVQIPVSFRRLDCDYFITSLHKWLGAPVGNGMLIVNRRVIKETWPLMAPFDAQSDIIDKFDHWNLGTYNSALQSGILQAIKNIQEISIAKIHRRINYLSNYWVNKARSIQGLRIYSPLNESSGAIVLFSIEGLDSRIIEKALREEHYIHVKYREVLDIKGLRVSPHISTSIEELDRFINALSNVVSLIRSEIEPQ